MTAADWVVGFFMLLAAVLLFVGLAQALDAGAHGRHRRRRATRPSIGRHPASAPGGSPAATAAQAAGSAGGLTVGVARSGAPEPASPQAGEPSGELVQEPAPIGAVEACLALYREGHHGDVLRRVAAHVSVAQGAEPHETALLWTLAALAHETIGEPDEARAAYDAAAWVMPDPSAPAPAWLGDAGGAVLRWLVAPARPGAEKSPHGAPRLHLSLAWLRALEASGSDEARTVMAEVGERLWTECGKRANACLSQQEFDAARDLAQQALGSAALPPGRQEEFRDLVSMSLAAEIGRLMARALERLDKPAEAVAALERGEAALRRVPVASLDSHQRQELERRLWWGYSRLAIQRLDAGAAEEAVHLFFQALAMAELDMERNSETRQSLGRAFEAWGAQVREAAAGGAAGGDRGTPAEQARRLRDALSRGLAAGLKEADLAGAFAVSQALQDAAE